MDIIIGDWSGKYFFYSYLIKANYYAFIYFLIGVYNVKIDQNDAIAIGMPCFLYTGCVVDGLDCIGRYLQPLACFDLAEEMQIHLESVHFMTADFVASLNGIVAEATMKINFIVRKSYFTI